jgi:hypothetical protein
MAINGVLRWLGVHLGEAVDRVLGGRGLLASDGPMARQRPHVTVKTPRAERQLRMFLGRHVMHNYASKAGDGRTGPLHSTASDIADKQGHPAQINRSGPGSRSSSAAAPASASACRCGGMWLCRLSQPGALISRRVVGLRPSSLVSSWVRVADDRIYLDHGLTGSSSRWQNAATTLNVARRAAAGRMQRELKRDIATIKATLEAASGPFERSG